MNAYALLRSHLWASERRRILTIEWAELLESSQAKVVGCKQAEPALHKGQSPFPSPPNWDSGYESLIWIWTTASSSCPLCPIAENRKSGSQLRERYSGTLKVSTCMKMSSWNTIPPFCGHNCGNSWGYGLLLVMPRYKVPLIKILAITQ